MGRVLNTLMHGWNRFQDTPPDAGGNSGGGRSMSGRPSRSSARIFNDRSIVTSIYTRMAVDFASCEFYHARLDTQGTAVDIIDDGLNKCLTLEANIDQTAHALKIDYAMTMFESGHAAIVPINSDRDPMKSKSYSIDDLRVGRVVDWRARSVVIEVYDDREFDDEGNPVDGGTFKHVWAPKDQVMIVENPFYGVMNEPNGLLQRLITKLALMDGIDEAAGSGKLDMLIQLPYTVRGDSRRKQAAQRRQDLREQLVNDELGIGYIDVSEKVIQLNRPIDNKLLDQIQFLYDAVKEEVGISKGILDNTATVDQINQYFDRTIEPIATGFALEAKRKFLTKTARAQRHSIEMYRDPLKLIPISELAEIIDKVTRSGVATSNELRPKIGLRPSSDPAANSLGNPNMPKEDQIGQPPAPEQVVDAPPEEVPNG